VRRALAPVLALVVVAGGLAGCGGHAGGQATTATRRAATSDAPATPAQRAALTARRRREAPHFSSAALRRRLTRLPQAQRRRPLLVALRRSVLRDARARARRGELEGRFLDVSCTVTRDDRPYARSHPGAPVLRYECLAITYRTATRPPVLIGKPFLARVDLAAARYAWCLFTPVGGEGAHTAATFAVQPSPACAAPPPS
jgi:hypothetical protein